MLRKFAETKRAHDDDYVEWVKRSTREAEAAAETTGIRLWLVAALRAKWMWAGHVQRMNAHRWAKRMTSWRNFEWWCVTRINGHVLQGLSAREQDTSNAGRHPSVSMLLLWDGKVGVPRRMF